MGFQKFMGAALKKINKNYVFLFYKIIIIQNIDMHLQWNLCLQVRSTIQYKRFFFTNMIKINIKELFFND